MAIDQLSLVGVLPGHWGATRAASRLGSVWLTAPGWCSLGDERSLNDASQQSAPSQRIAKRRVHHYGRRTDAAAQIVTVTTRGRQVPAGGWGVSC